MSQEIQAFISDGVDSVDQDYAALRQKAIEKIQSLSGQTWTDHNAHDVGITAIDALCFAITEQGHLNNLSTEDLLKLYGSEDATTRDFFGAEVVLHNDPVTLLDWRKFLIDRTDIRNAWLNPITGNTAPQLLLKNNQYSLADGVQVKLKGLYDVLIEWENVPSLGELNGNMIMASVTVALPNGVQKSYRADITFPFGWDTEDANFKAFRNKLNIFAITATTGFVQPKLEQMGIGSNTYFSDLLIHLSPVSAITVGIILRINTEITSELERSIVESRFGALLSANPGVVSLYNDIVVKGYSLSQTTRALLSAKRNLAEDFVALRAISIQEIAIQAEIDLVPGSPVEDILAEMFLTLDRFISPQFHFEPYENETREGPKLVNGYLSDEQLTGAPGRSIFLSDLLNIMLENSDGKRREQIVAIYNLSIQSYINNKEAGRSQENCLRLVDDPVYRPRLSVFKSHIVINSRDTVVPYDINKVFSKYLALKNTVPASTTVSSVATLPDMSVVKPLPGYHPVQYEFPAFYHLSLPSNTAINLQMRGYLFFFEQVLANASSLLRNSPKLLSIGNNDLETSYPANLRELLPFYNDYLNPSYESALATSTSANEARRSLMLDHLLARLGEDFRYFASWNSLTTSQVNTAKYNFLKALPVLAGARFKAYDYSSPAWNTINVSTTEQKLKHLLQLPDITQKKLWRDPSPNFNVVATAGPNVTYGFRVTDAANTPLLKSAADTFEFQFEAEDNATDLILYGREIGNYNVIRTGAVFSFAVVDPENYTIAISENTFATSTLAAAAIQSTITFLKQWLPLEGLHIVENILLRPQFYSTPGLFDTLLTIPLLEDGSISPAFGNDLYSQQVLVVLPRGGNRFGSPAFQDIAREVIRREFPSWIKVRVVWLNIFMMHEFELAYQSFVQTKSNNAATESAMRLAKGGLVDALNKIYRWLNIELR